MVPRTLNFAAQEMPCVLARVIVLEGAVKHLFRVPDLNGLKGCSHSLASV